MTFQRIPDELLARATPQERKAYAKALARHLALSSPLDFALATRRGAQEYRHTRFISNKIMEVPAGGGLILTMGPRQGKSYLVSETTPAWALANNPDARIIHATYGENFTMKLSSKVRRIIQENAGGLCPRLNPAKKAVNDFEVHPDDGEGFYFGTGVGGGATGLGADWMILDDLIKNADEARSQVMRDAAWDWYASVAEERLEPGARTLYIGTRWHEDDVGGRLIELYKDDPLWTIINLPSIAEEDDPLGREPGEALCPERFPIEALLRKKKKDPYFFAAMHQGQPTPAGGGTIKREHIKLWKELPPKEQHAFRFAAMDTADSEKETADYTVLTIFLVTRPPHPKLIVTHIFRERVDSGSHMEWVKEKLDAVPRSQRPSWILVENKTFGSTLMATYRRRPLRGVPSMRPCKADKDKKARARPLSNIASQGQFWIPSDHPERETAITECVMLPNGKHDDIVDTFAYGAIEFINMPASAVPEPDTEFKAPTLEDKMRKHMENKARQKRRTHHQRTRSLMR